MSSSTAAAGGAAPRGGPSPEGRGTTPRHPADPLASPPPGDVARELQAPGQITALRIELLELGQRVEARLDRQRAERVQLAKHPQRVVTPRAQIRLTPE